MELLEAIFLILAPILFIAALVNGFMMQARMRKLRKLLIADGRCPRCFMKLDESGRCPDCDRVK